MKLESMSFRNKIVNLWKVNYEKFQHSVYINVLLAIVVLLSSQAAFCGQSDVKVKDSKSILVETESFDNYSGWSLDTQFMDQMGSPYLIAHGLGRPVDNASTTVKCTESGRHRVWVRTFDWVDRRRDDKWPKRKRATGEAPGRIKSGTVRKDTIAHIDMAATSLYFAGIDIPDYMQARPLFGPQGRPREYVVCACDRCDEAVDHIHSVVKGSYKYIRNFYPKRPYLQPCAYKDHKPFMKQLRKLHSQGKLNKVQSLHLAQSPPEEELYYLSKDRWEVHNLARRPEYKNILRQIRGILANWIIESDDKGRFPESEDMFDSDMKVYIDRQKRAGNTECAQEVEDNINTHEKVESIREIMKVASTIKKGFSCL